MPPSSLAFISICCQWLLIGHFMSCFIVLFYCLTVYIFRQVPWAPSKTGREKKMGHSYLQALGDGQRERERDAGLEPAVIQILRSMDSK